MAKFIFNQHEEFKKFIDVINGIDDCKEMKLVFLDDKNDIESEYVYKKVSENKGVSLYNSKQVGESLNDLLSLFVSKYLDKDKIVDSSDTYELLKDTVYELSDIKPHYLYLECSIK